MPLRRVVVLAFVVAAPFVGAQPADFAHGARVLLEKQGLPNGGEVEVVVGEIDPRLTLAPCARHEPFIPPGAKLWGRSSLGVRCVEGANWSVFVPIEVRVWSMVPVAARPIARGRPVTPDDVRLDRVDVTRVTGNLLSPEESFDGNVAVRSIGAGEPLRRDLLRPPPILAAGDPVRVVYDGIGFAISIEGKALAPAGDGQTVRVATAAGRVLSGVARPGHLVVVK